MSIQQINPGTSVVKRSFARIAGGANQVITTAPTVIRALENFFTNDTTLFDSPAIGSIRYIGTAPAYCRVTYTQTCFPNSNIRSTANHLLYLNGNPAPNGRTWSYHRSLEDGFSSSGSSLILEIPVNGVIDLRTRIASAGDRFSCLNNQTIITIEFLEES